MFPSFPLSLKINLLKKKLLKNKDCILFLDRGERREEEREGNINV